MAALVARNHLEDVRLESTFMIIGAEQVDTLDLIAWANLRRSWLHEPMVGIRLRFGDQPISVAAIFNTRTDRAAAEAYARAADGAESAGRQLKVEKLFQLHKLPLAPASLKAVDHEKDTRRNGRSGVLRVGGDE